MHPRRSLTKKKSEPIDWSSGCLLMSVGPEGRNGHATSQKKTKADKKAALLEPIFCSSSSPFFVTRQRCASLIDTSCLSQLRRKMVLFSNEKR